MTEPRIYRASSLGYSLEQLVAPHLGYEAIPPPEWLQNAFDEGSELESTVIEKLRDRGWRIQDEQLEVELEVIPGIAKVVGHLDGIGHPSDLPGGVVEIKTMSDKSWRDFALNGWASTSPIITKYKWQASAYMLATGKPHYMVAWNKATQEIYVEYVVEPFFTIADIANKLQAAEDHIKDGVIPEGCTDYPCPYFYLHAEREEAEPADKDLDALLAAWLEAQRREKVYGREKDELKAMIVEYVGQEGKAKIKGSNGVTVSVNWQAGGEVKQVRTAKWVTTISAPRKGKSVTD